MHLLHGAPRLKDNRRIATESLPFSFEGLLFQQRDQSKIPELPGETRQHKCQKVATAKIHGFLRGLEPPSAKGPMALIPSSLHLQINSAEEFQAQASHRLKNCSCFPFSFLITCLASEYVQRLQEVMSDQIALVHTYSNTESFFATT